MNILDFLTIITPILLGIYIFLISKGILHKSSKWVLRLKERYGKFLKLFSVILIFAGLLVAYGVYNRNIPSPDLKIKLNEASIYLNKSLPKMIDRETELRDVKINGTELVYNYRFITTKKGEMDMSVFTNGIFIIQRSSFCSDKMTAELISKGASIKAVYYTMDNEEITSIVIDKKICN